MVSLITAPNHFLVPPRLVGDLNFPAISQPLVVAVSPIRCRRGQRPQPAVCVDLENWSFGFGDLKRRRYEGYWCCWCKGWDSEGDSALEAEILELMKQSKKPEVFLTKAELVDAGRMDLAEAIVKRGGWLSLGWDLDDDNEEEKVQENRRTARDCDDERVGVQENGRVGGDCDDGVLVGGVIRDYQQTVENRSQSYSFEGASEVGRFEVSSDSVNSSRSPSFSGGSLGMGDEEETGIEGTLNLNFGIDLVKNGYSTHVLSKYGDDSHVRRTTSRDADGADLGGSTPPSVSTKGIFKNSGGKFSQKRSVSDFDGSKNSLHPEMSRTWSMQRPGFSDANYEASEISFNVNQMREAKDASKEEILAMTEGSTQPLDKQKEISHNEMQTRLQHLELELTSALRLLWSKSKEFVPKECHETSSNDFSKLSDAWEFQENEIMNAQDRLQSIRAKLAVLEGKMALAIIDAQKIVEGKEKRIDGARRALQLLRSACIVWPNSASEVKLAGSYDGWTTQRKMEKSKTGIFCVCLRLYPGRYEIKFIVDGVWGTDPLRPVVHNNGSENNLLIVM